MVHTHRGERFNRLKALVVEDQPDYAMMLSDLFIDQGFEVDIATNGDLARERVRECRPDVITLDLRMPEMGGVEFFREVKGDPELREIPLVIVTGIARDDPEMAEFVRNFLEDEHLPMPDAYLEKPVDNEDFFRVIHDALSSDAGAREEE